jgi:SRSO17 transposase
MVRDGEKGPVAIEMVVRRVQTRIERKRLGPEEWLVVTRRPLADERTLEPRASRDATDQDTQHRYQYYLTPTSVSGAALQEPSLAELARVIKAGACIEASFTRGKSEVGMDEYQVRTWEGWHHHIALSLLAVWFLIGETHRGQQVTPSPDPATSALWAEPAPAGSVFHAWCGRDLPSSPASITAQRVGEILPSPHP